MTSTPDDPLLQMTADIVSAHTGFNPVPKDQLPGLISEVYSTLSGLGQQPENGGQTSTLGIRPVDKPMVDPHKSVFPDYIICLEDGLHLKMLKRHLATAYRMTPDEYRAKWGLPPSYPMVAPAYAETRSKLAKSSGLGTRRMAPMATVEAEDEIEAPAPKKVVAKLGARRGRPKKAIAKKAARKAA